MRRIGLAVVVPLCVFVAPFLGEAQQADKVYRIGVLVVSEAFPPSALPALPS